MSRSFRQWLRLLLIIGMVLLIDQVSKAMIVERLHLGESVSPIPALSPYFQLTRSQNTGSAFGFLPQAGDVFLIIAVVVVFAMIIFFPRIPERATLTRFATALVCGGALGNALDRIHYGAVVDFIHYQIPGVVSNVSNLADHAIVFGVLMIFIESWRHDSKQKAQPEPAEATAPEDRVS
jgi:signal peptidase II